ncbi:aconitate hydratase [uncultured archaeon]|nr:aconitate hydratase [uncultured archaeon]
MPDDLRILKQIEVSGKEYNYFSLPDLEKKGYNISKLPRSIRIVLESLIRNLDGKAVREKDVLNLLNWNSKDPGKEEIPFKVSRVVMQDFTGVPAVVDLAALRDTAKRLGKDPSIIQPQVPVDLVIDHSVQVDFYGTPTSIEMNTDREFERNGERYLFLKWAQNSFKNLRIVPPSVGIVHQVNLEYLGKVVMEAERDGKTYAFPDTLVGTDSHTTMINGLGVVGWGVGGIEAEAAMLDQPVTILTPEVVGVNLHGKLKPGVTATDLVLTLTELLRRNRVVGKFVEFYGEGVTSLPLPDRATLSNMCPEYGATLALFPVDDETLKYLRTTGRSDEHVELIEKYLKAQGLYGSPDSLDYSQVIDLDLSSVTPTVAGPKLPNQKVEMGHISNSFLNYMEGNSDIQMMDNGQRSTTVSLKSVPVSVKGEDTKLSDGDVVIAAITSCTNTSNPQVMVAAGLLAKKAAEKGLTVSKKVKTSLAPGSRVVTDYLGKSGLQEYLDKLGFYLVGYGCTTCIGNSGPLDENIEKAIVDNNLSTAAVLSGNRNFEARIHKNVRANYLMSPPLVVAFAIAGKVTINLEKEPIGKDRDGKDVFLKEIWPSDDEISNVINETINVKMFREKYKNLDIYNEKWSKLNAPTGTTYDWEDSSTYIRNPPFFDDFSPDKSVEMTEVSEARPLLILGDSVTTDHISPAGAISKNSPAGKYLMENGVEPVDFNSFGSRRGNHEVMMRGTFGNVRIRNKLVDKEGGFTLHLPDKKETTVYDAAMQYVKEKTPLLVFAGIEYGTGSSRDWAAKGTMLLGVKAVVARSYERIHRSNLIGMGVLPLQFKEGEEFGKLDADWNKPFTVKVPENLEPGTQAELSYTDNSGNRKKVAVGIRLDTPIEVEYFKSGGILQYVLRKILQN